jgi:hypothetical protein
VHHIAAIAGALVVPARIIFTLQYFDLLTHGLARLTKR